MANHMVFVERLRRLLSLDSDEAEHAVGRHLAAMGDRTSSAALLSLFGEVASAEIGEVAVVPAPSTARERALFVAGRRAAMQNVLDGYIAGVPEVPTNFHDRILAVLAESKGGLAYPSDLVIRFDTSKAQVSRALQTLEGEGLVEEASDRLGDRRRRPRRLTALGRKHARELANA